MLGNVDPNKLRIEAWAPTVYTGFDNVTAARFIRFDDIKRRDVPLDFLGLTRAVLVFPEADPAMVFDSALHPEAFDWAQGDGVIQFNLSTFAVPEGVFNAELLVFDAQHARGQVLVSLQTPREGLALRFDQVGSEGALPAPRPGVGLIITRPAAETISALRGVIEGSSGLSLANPLLDSVQGLLGLSVTAGAPGADIQVQRTGTIDNAGWAWAEGPVFLGADGMLTQVLPVVGWEVVVGWAPLPTRLNINIEEPVLLA